MEDLRAKGMRNANQVFVIIIFHFLFLFLLHGFLNVILKIMFQALLSGCSAGGLASILKCDEFRGLFPSRTKVKCLSDGGLFLDA